MKKISKDLTIAASAADDFCRARTPTPSVRIGSKLTARSPAPNRN